jgi:hypothetical protein
MSDTKTAGKCTIRTRKFLMNKLLQRKQMVRRSAGAAAAASPRARDARLIFLWSAVRAALTSHTRYTRRSRRNARTAHRRDPPRPRRRAEGGADREGRQDVQSQGSADDRFVWPQVIVSARAREARVQLDGAARRAIRASAGRAPTGVNDLLTTG